MNIQPPIVMVQQRESQLIENQLFFSQQNIEQLEIDEELEKMGKIFNEFIHNLLQYQIKFQIPQAIKDVTKKLSRAGERDASLLCSDQSVQNLNQAQNFSENFDNEVDHRNKLNKFIMLMINTSMYSLGKWSLYDQARVKRQLCFLEKYFHIYISEYRGLGFLQIKTSNKILNVLVRKCVEIKPTSIQIKFKYQQQELSNSLCPNQSTEQFLIELSQHKRLMNLSLTMRNVRDLQFLSGLMNLARLKSLTLDLANNKISDLILLSNLKYIIDLRTLRIDLSNNMIMDLNAIKDIKYLVNLTSFALNLGYNHITDLSPLSNLNYLINLTTLTLILQSNKIINLSPISNLKYLVNLSCLEVDIKDNKIIDLTPLFDLKYLVNLIYLTLILGPNKITNITLINHLKFFLKITNFYLD